MMKQPLKYFALSLTLVALVLSTSLSMAQGKPVGLGRMGPRRASYPPVRLGHAPAPGSASYTFSYFAFPRAQYTEGFAINSGAASSKIEIVGNDGAQVPWGSGLLLEVSESKGTIREAYTNVNLPGYSLQQTDGINDSGYIVGNYIDNSSNVQGYLLSGGVFTPIQVPFSGATSTLPSDINNSDEIVGVWEEDANEVAHSFVLSGGVYTSFDYPGGLNTQAIANNNKGDIVGYYNDSAGVYHGFLLSGGTYTSFDVPGAALTLGFGINDGGTIVGVYCTASDCTDSSGEQGFLLSAGVFTTINVPNAISTALSDINNTGVLVGWYSDCGGAQLGFVATP